VADVRFRPERDIELLELDFGLRARAIHDLARGIQKLAVQLYREDRLRRSSIDPISNGKMASKKKQRSHTPSATNMPMRPTILSNAVETIKTIARFAIKVQFPS
jgi:hypothetical protein